MIGFGELLAFRGRVERETEFSGKRFGAWQAFPALELTAIGTDENEERSGRCAMLFGDIRKIG
jgi:hypothetical protein